MISKASQQWSFQGACPADPPHSKDNLPATFRTASRFGIDFAKRYIPNHGASAPWTPLFCFVLPEGAVAPMTPTWKNNLGHLHVKDTCISNWCEKDAKMMWKWCRCQTESQDDLMLKFFGKDPKLIPKWCQNDRNDTTDMPQRYQKGAEMIPTLTKMMRKWF